MKITLYELRNNILETLNFLFIVPEFTLEMLGIIGEAALRVGNILEIYVSTNLTLDFGLDYFF